MLSSAIKSVPPKSTTDRCHRLRHRISSRSWLLQHPSSSLAIVFQFLFEATRRPPVALDRGIPRLCPTDSQVSSPFTLLQSTEQGTPLCLNELRLALIFPEYQQLSRCPISLLMTCPDECPNFSTRKKLPLGPDGNEPFWHRRLPSTSTVCFGPGSASTFSIGTALRPVQTRLAASQPVLSGLRPSCSIEFAPCMYDDRWVRSSPWPSCFA